MVSRVARFYSYESAPTGGANFIVRDQFAFDHSAIFSRLDNPRSHSYRPIRWRRSLQRDRVVGGDCARRFVGAGFLHQVPGSGPVAMTIEQRADNAAAQHARKCLVLFARLPLSDNFIAVRKAADVQSLWIRGATSETGKIWCKGFLDAFVHLFCTLNLVLGALSVFGIELKRRISRRVNKAQSTKHPAQSVAFRGLNHCRSLNR